MIMENIICPECGGSGTIIVEGIGIDCCGKCHETGYCCGNGVPVPVPEPAMCPRCNGCGEIMEKIFLQIGEDAEKFTGPDGVTWNEQKIFTNDIEYIRFDIFEKFKQEHVCIPKHILDEMNKG